MRHRQTWAPRCLFHLLCLIKWVEPNKAMSSHMAVATFASCKACIACCVPACTIQAVLCIHMLCLSPYIYIYIYIYIYTYIHTYIYVCVCSTVHEARMFLTQAGAAVLAAAGNQGLSSVTLMSDTKKMSPKITPVLALSISRSLRYICQHTLREGGVRSTMQCLVALFKAHDPKHPHQHKMRDDNTHWA